MTPLSYCLSYLLVPGQGYLTTQLSDEPKQLLMAILATYWAFKR